MTPPPRKPPWLARLRAWPRFLFSGRADAAHLYDLRGEGAIEGAGAVPVVNMGHWEGLDRAAPDVLRRANYAMFDRVARGAADVLPGGRVLDAGCGFGTNAVHLMETYAPAKVTSVNVSAVQLTSARARAEAAGVADRVEFLLASVTALPLPDASIDAVVSVEAAFHFDTREAFFAEAMRVLRPGGVLSMVDLVVPPAHRWWHAPALDLICRSQAIPRANVYGFDEFVRRVGASGLHVEEVESIVHHVFPPFRRWMLTRPPAVYLRYDLPYIAASLPYLAYPFDYVRVVARKPG